MPDTLTAPNSQKICTNCRGKIGILESMEIAGDAPVCGDCFLKLMAVRSALHSKSEFTRGLLLGLGALPSIALGVFIAMAGYTVLMAAEIRSAVGQAQENRAVAADAAVAQKIHDQGTFLNLDQK